MPIRFVHAADIHLGYRQYSSNQRYNDFAKAFRFLVDETIARRADALLLAGDIFHKRAIAPHTLLQATRLLDRLRRGGIPVIAVQGNHERPRQGEVASWLDYLADVDLLRLITVRYREGTILVDPWDGKTRRGAYVDLPGGLRVMGVQYYGATTSRVVSDLIEVLPQVPGPRPPFSILMLHAGLEGILHDYSGTLTRAQLEPLRQRFDYLALGHIHKPFVQDDWIYNPGSLETNSMSEEPWRDRGFLVVDIDPARQPAHTVERVVNPRREFIRYAFDVTRHESPEALLGALCRFVDSKATDAIRAKEPVVEVQITGTLTFSRSELDLRRVEQMVHDAFAATVVRVRDTTTTSDFDIETGQSMTRADLERHVLRDLVERDTRYRGRGEAWANLMVRIKQMTLTGSPPEDVVAELEALTEQSDLAIEDASEEEEPERDRC